MLALLGLCLSSPAAGQSAPTAVSPPTQAAGGAASTQAAGGSATSPAAAPAPAPPQPAPPVAQRLDVAAELALGSLRLTSAEAARRAIATAPAIDKARAATAVARASADTAFAHVYPTVSVEARYSRNNQASAQNLRRLYETIDELGAFLASDRGDPPPDPIKTPVMPAETYSLVGQVSLTLSDLWLTVLPRYEASLGRVRYRELQERAQARIVALQAQEAFWAYARTRAAHVVASAGVALYEALRADVEGLVRAGALAQVELLRARAQVASAEVAAANVEAQQAIARAQLSVMLGDLPDGELAIGDDLSSQPAPFTRDEGSLRTLALKSRSDLKALRTLAAAYESDISARRADGLPKLGIGATGEYENPNRRIQSIYDRWDTSWSAYASLRWTPNDLLLSLPGAEGLRSERAQVEADIRALERAVKVEVSQAHATYRAAAHASRAAAAGIDAAEESYRIRQAQFRAGSAVATDVIDAEEKLRRARLDLVNAAINLHVARARLDRVVEAPLDDSGP